MIRAYVSHPLMVVSPSATFLLVGIQPTTQSGCIQVGPQLPKDIPWILRALDDLVGLRAAGSPTPVGPPNAILTPWFSSCLSSTGHTGEGEVI